MSGLASAIGWFFIGLYCLGLGAGILGLGIIGAFWLASPVFRRRWRTATGRVPHQENTP